MINDAEAMEAALLEEPRNKREQQSITHHNEMLSHVKLKAHHVSQQNSDT